MRSSTPFTLSVVVFVANKNIVGDTKFTGHFDFVNAIKNVNILRSLNLYYTIRDTFHYR